MSDGSNFAVMSVGATSLTEETSINLKDNDNKAVKSYDVKSPEEYADNESEITQDEINIENESIESSIIECTSVDKKSGRHQLHPFSIATTLEKSTESINNEEEVLLNVEILDANKLPKTSEEATLNSTNTVLPIDDGTQSESALINFPVVSSKPGRHQMHPISAPNSSFPTSVSTSDTEVKKTDDTSGQNKRGTLSRMLKNLKSTNKFLQDEKVDDMNSKPTTQKDIPQQIEGNNTKTSVGAIGKMFNKVNIVSKESKTNISKAIHRISDVITSGFKNEKRDAQEKSTLSLNLTTKLKYSSLGRKLSPHFSKENMTLEGDNITLQGENLYEEKCKTLNRNKRSNTTITESNTMEKLKKDSLGKESNILLKKISSISTQFLSKNTQNDEIGEMGDDNINEDGKTEPPGDNLTQIS